MIMPHRRPDCQSASMYLRAKIAKNWADLEKKSWFYEKSHPKTMVRVTYSIVKK